MPIQRTINESFIVDGSGLYTKAVAREVKAIGMELDISTWEHFKEESPEDPPYGQLNVYFDTTTWDTSVDGLIYTDDHFLADLKDFLTRAGYNAEVVDYSEMGMQGDTFVNLDVGADFINSWKAIHVSCL